MKRFVFALLLSALIPVFAEARTKIAVLNLETGTGLTTSQVDGLQSMLISALQNSGEFVIIERDRVKDLIRELGISNGKRPTKSQLSRFSQRLGVKAVVVGTANFQARDRYIKDVITGTQRGEYNIDIRLVSTETGEVLSSAGDTQSSSETTRSLMNRLSKRLIDGFEDPSATNTLSGPMELNGYLLVYPKDLGLFSTPPYQTIEMINRQASYGYTDWRLPSPEELSQMKANLSSLGMKNKYVYATSNSSFGANKNLAVRLVRSKIIAQKAAIADGTLRVIPRVIDLGTIPVLRGSKEGSFKVVNEGSEAVTINSISSPSSNIEILPYVSSVGQGDTNIIRFKLSVNGRQGISIKRHIEVEFSNGMRSTVTVKAYVE